jgi:flagellar biosynthesis chaperone FliJ
MNMTKYIIQADFAVEGAILTAQDIEFEAKSDAAAIAHAEALQNEYDFNLIKSLRARGLTASQALNTNDFLNAQSFTANLYKVTGVDEYGLERLQQIEP